MGAILNLLALCLPDLWVWRLGKNWAEGRSKGYLNDAVAKKSGFDDPVYKRKFKS